MSHSIVLGMLASLLVGFTPMKSVDRNPVGETASYNLDKDKNRTSGMIKQGAGVALIDSHAPNHESGPSYNTTLSYKLSISLYGESEGAIKLPLPESYFTAEFLPNLRRSGTFQTPDFKLKHLGIEDATTMDGRKYLKCDKIFFYDVKVTEADKMGILPLLIAAAGFSPDDKSITSNDIKDLKVQAYVYPGIPAYGAVKLDISGTVKGVSAKAGLDYKTP